MSIHSEDETKAVHCTDSIELEKKARITYARDFLLSLCELDVCKKLPPGFDQALLSDFEDTSQDRSRVPGGFSLQSYRRNEYGTSPPTRGDVNSYSRSNQGRWDSHSSGRSDRDGDFQSDRNSDSGRRYGIQTRKPWQGAEHDGLLGSGSFHKPPGLAGSSAPNFRANENYQLNRTNEPYQPPRPYKAVPHSRRETNDSYNDETFGSSDCTSEDRAEEERKRRESFDLLRKEQQKAFQERQKVNPVKFKDEFDITELLEDAKECKTPPISESDETPVEPSSNSNSNKPPPPTLASRPLVPPGFSATSVEKNMGAKSLSYPQPSVVGNEPEGNLLQVKGRHSIVESTASNDQELQHLGQPDQSEQQRGSPIHVSADNGKRIESLSWDISTKTISTTSLLEKSPDFVEAFDTSRNRKDIETNIKDVIGNKTTGPSAQIQSTSILHKLFDNASTPNGGGSISSIKNHDVKVEDMWSPSSPCSTQSSKFAQWFLEEEKPNKNMSSVGPNNLLSLVVCSDKTKSEADDKATAKIQPSYPLNSKLADRHVAVDFKSSNVLDTEHLLKTGKSEVVPAVLTCEDLEQSILSGLSGNASSPNSVEISSSVEKEHKKSNIDDHASLQLLSLLHKGTGPNDMIPSANPASTLLDKQSSNEVAALGSSVLNRRVPDAENSSSRGKALTLETLFGSAFMKELQPVGAAPSGSKGLVGPARPDVQEFHGSPFPATDNTFISSALESPSMRNHETTLWHPSVGQLHGITSQSETGSQLHTDTVSKPGGFDRSADIQLPEDNKLIVPGDPLLLHNVLHAGNLVKDTATTVEINKNLAPLNSLFKNERSIIGGEEDSSFVCGPYDRDLDIQSRNLQIHPSQQLQSPQMKHVSSMLHHLDSHLTNLNSPTELMGSENIFPHEIPNHRISSNMLQRPLHHPNAGATGFDHTIHGPMFQQIPGHLPVSQLPHGFPSTPPFPNNPMAAYIQEPNRMQAFPSVESQPNIGGPGFPPQGDVGGRTNTPDALQRLIEMELRSKAKQVPPFVMAGHRHGTFGHELGMGSGYR